MKKSFALADPSLLLDKSRALLTISGSGRDPTEGRSSSHFREATGQTTFRASKHVACTGEQCFEQIYDTWQHLIFTVLVCRVPSCPLRCGARSRIHSEGANAATCHGMLSHRSAAANWQLEVRTANAQDVGVICYSASI